MDYTVPFADAICTDPAYVGGKAASLSVLKRAAS